jgi:hypothetical protein
MSGQGCPLCRLADRAERHFIDSLSYERVLDLKTRAALQASRGLCASHIRQWQTLQGGALGVAIVYRVAVLDLLRETETSLQPSGGFLRRGCDAAQLARDLESSGPCPVCEIGHSTAQRFAELLLKDIPAAEVQALLQACGGLCLPHLRLTLSQPGAGKASRPLLEAQRAAWQTLMGEMDEFIRKNDYRFRHEALTDAEADSWIRAIDALVGQA